MTHPFGWVIFIENENDSNFFKFRFSEQFSDVIARALAPVAIRNPQCREADSHGCYRSLGMTVKERDCSINWDL